MPGVRPVSVAVTAVAVEPVSGEGVAATVGGESSTTRSLSVGDEDVAGRVHRHAGGSLNPEPMGRMVPLGRTSLMALLPVSATKTSPAASTATPRGSLNPEPMVRWCRWAGPP